MRHLAACTVVLAFFVACAGAPPEASVRPGINEDFLDPALDVDAMVRRFEAESREIFARRAAIARAVGLREGMAVADIGAGTGVFVDFFARDVGATGRVFAVEIAPKFVDLLRERAATRGQTQVEVVLCSDRDVGLAAGSVDVVFTCDTYHHFEYPRSTLASIHRALRDGGELVVVDFERIPGVSRPWILDHVRCGKDQVVVEVLGAGFELIEEVRVELRENYFLRFRKLGADQRRPS
ncbi:MAG: class I SAM-dependent methyltransferase [Planctomycetes bacterium]|nr:class I SAM-dependent methyltransferase [Planctomycetota bacterium]